MLELLRMSMEVFEEDELVLSELGVVGIDWVIGAGSSASGELRILFILGIGVRGKID